MYNASSDFCAQTIQNLIFTAHFPSCYKIKCKFLLVLCYLLLMYFRISCLCSLVFDKLPRGSFELYIFTLAEKLVYVKTYIKVWFLMTWALLIRPTFWHVSMNSSMVTTPSLFRSIFWNKGVYRDQRWSWLADIISTGLLKVCYLEEFLHVFKRCIVFYTRKGTTAHHVIYGLHDSQHFLKKVNVNCGNNAKYVY